MGAQTKRLPYDVRRGLLAHEEKSGARSQPADLLRDLESIHLRQVDVEQNQIGLQFSGLPNRLQPVRRLHGLELRPFVQRHANEAAEQFMVLDDENPQRHSGVTVTSGEQAPGDSNEESRVGSAGPRSYDGGVRILAGLGVSAP